LRHLLAEEHLDNHALKAALGKLQGGRLAGGRLCGA
jgi:hypothetical protein